MECKYCGHMIPKPKGVYTCQQSGCSCIHVSFYRRLILGGTRHSYLALNPKDELLKRFKVTDCLGAGVHAVTLRAHDPLLGGPVALRLLAHSKRWLDFHGGSAQLLKEAQAYRLIDHSNVVHLYDVLNYWDSYEEFNRPVIKMQLIEGRALGDCFEERLVLGLPSHLVLSRVMEALVYCHHRKVYHGDLHPGNILLTPDKGPVLIDFAASDFRSFVVPHRRRRADFHSLWTLARDVHKHCGDEQELRYFVRHRYRAMDDLRDAYLSAIDLSELHTELTKVVAQVKTFNAHQTGLLKLSFVDNNTQDVCDIWQIFTEPIAIEPQEAILRGIESHQGDIQKLADQALSGLSIAASRIYEEWNTGIIDTKALNDQLLITDGGFEKSVEDVSNRLHSPARRKLHQFLSEWIANRSLWS